MKTSAAMGYIRVGTQEQGGSGLGLAIHRSDVVSGESASKNYRA
jgi:hypothetical protein